MSVISVRPQIVNHRRQNFWGIKKQHILISTRKRTTAIWLSWSALLLKFVSCKGWRRPQSQRLKTQRFAVQNILRAIRRNTHSAVKGVSVEINLIKNEFNADYLNLYRFVNYQWVSAWLKCEIDAGTKQITYTIEYDKVLIRTTHFVLP